MGFLCNKMKKIKLTKGQFALVDDEDFEKINKFKWYATFDKRKKTFYAHRRPLLNGFKKTISMHRIIMDCPTNKVVDHINHVTLDNQKNNLRICDSKENARNSRISKKNTTGFKGVSQYKKSKYKSYIIVNRKYIHLGVFDDKETAHNAYIKASIKYHKEFACSG